MPTHATGNKIIYAAAASAAASASLDIRFCGPYVFVKARTCLLKKKAGIAKASSAHSKPAIVPVTYI